MHGLAANFTNTIGLGSVVNLIAILTFIGVVGRYLHKFLSKIESMEEMPTEVRKVADELRSISEQTRLWREESVQWRKESADWHERHLRLDHGRDRHEH